MTAFGQQDRESAGLDAIGLGMADDRNRALLADWLATSSQYEVTVFEAGDDVPTDYDICLLDAATLAACRDELVATDDDAAPVYLPHVLLATDPDEGAAIADRHADATVDTLVDDVFTLPIPKARLHQRIENLLQTRHASRRLAEREQQYRELVALTPESILLVDDGVVVYANEAASTLLTTDNSDALVGRSLDEFVPAADQPALDELLDEIAATDAQPDDYVDVAFTSTTGVAVDAAVTGVRVTFEGRQVAQLVVRDLSEQRRRERRLDLLGRAIEAADQGISIADAQQEDTPLVYANAGFERITGYDLEEVVGENCRFLQGARTDADTVAAIREAVDDGVPVSVDILNYRRDGAAFWNHLDIVPIADEDGTITHFLGFQRDITERKQREQRLSVMNRVLRHNLRNKLSLVLGYADAIDAGDATPADGAAEIRAAATDLLDVSEQVRKFDTVVSGSHEEPASFDIVSVLTDDLAVLQERYPDASLEVTTPSEAVISGDPALPDVLADLVEQLVGTGVPDATVEVSEADGRVTLSVTDRSGSLLSSDLEVIERGTETPLEHLQGVYLWLLRWTVEQSHGEINADTDGDHPSVRLTFEAADE